MEMPTMRNFNFEEIDFLLLDNPEEYRLMLKQMIETNAEAIQKFEKALANNDLDLFSKTRHNLVPLAKMFKYEDLTHWFQKTKEDKVFLENQGEALEEAKVLMSFFNERLHEKLNTLPKA